jgi:hypothetical protein
MGRHGLVCSGLRQGQVTGTCEFGDERSSSIKCGEFLDYLRTCQRLRKDTAPWFETGMRRIIFYMRFEVLRALSIKMRVFHSED